MRIGLRSARTLVRACVLLCGFGMCSPALFAYPVTWEFSGTVTSSAGSASTLSEDLPLGAPVRVVVGFDTDEAYTTRLSSGGRPGIRYQYFGAPSLTLAIIGGNCNPCTPVSIPENNLILVRDDFADPVRNPPPDVAYDGYSFGMDPDPLNDNYSFLVLLRDFSSAFDPPVVDVGIGENPLPIEPDPRLVDMATAVLEISRDQNVLVTVEFDAVTIPTFGTYYFLSARHCLYPDATPPTQTAFLGDDCVAGGGVEQPLVAEIGGGAGHLDFSRTVTPEYATLDPNDAPEAVDELGTVFGAITFGGPGGMPVLRGSSLPTDVSRTNSNLLAYQQYSFNGTQPTPLQLVVDLGYSIHSDSPVTYYPPENYVQPGAVIPVAVRPGGAGISTVLAVIDGSLVPPVAMGAVQDFGALVCGNEDNLLLPNGDPWPAGSILGNAIYQSPESEEGAQTVRLDVLGCDGDIVSTEPVEVSPGDAFYLAASMQTPARGLLAQDGSEGAPANGFVDAANTIRIIPDPEAPPEVLQQLVGGITPVCEDCEFAPEIAMDLKPGDAQNVVKVGSKSVIPVALFGSAALAVSEVVASSLKLGTTPVRAKKGVPSCATQDVNLDSVADLVCQFENVAGNWQIGQTIATLSALLANGETILASDAVVVK